MLRPQRKNETSTEVDPGQTPGRGAWGDQRPPGRKALSCCRACCNLPDWVCLHFSPETPPPSHPAALAVLPFTSAPNPRLQYHCHGRKEEREGDKGREREEEGDEKEAGSLEDKEVFASGVP